ncbi:sulfatase [Celerinatantimonas sp. YJH-8]|uniref:sulfatase family protein n=1 Tax=Celerinatantimonas sp. YJH-8 TaxID=3228714 RepID=UPI0038C143D6
MKSLSLLACATATALAITYSGMSQATISPELKKPNIVFVLTEDMNTRLGVYGDTVARTPNLDKLAQSSVTFTNAFTMAGVSAPSRTGLITGVFPQFLGLQNMRTATFPEGGYVGVPPAYIKAYPELLRRNGYFTYNDLKTDYQFTKGALDVGPFTIWTKHGTPKNFDDFVVGRHVPWRTYKVNKSQPMFIELNPMITHESGLFTKETCPKGFEMLMNVWDKVRSQTQYTPTDPASVKVDPFWVDNAKVRQELALFYDNIHIMDKEVGDVIRKLKADGRWDNTIFIFSADNGDGLPRHKREGYDSGTHVPLIIHIPDQYKPKWWPKDGSKLDRLVSFEDLAPTILGFAGLPKPAYMQGVDLSKDAPASRKYVYGDRARMDTAAMRSYFIRSDQYQYVRNMDSTPGGTHIAFRDQLHTTSSLYEGEKAGTLNKAQLKWLQPRPAEELYDLSKDPYQLHNIATDPHYARVKHELRDQLYHWRNRGNDMSLVAEGVMKKDLLDANGQQKVTLPPVVEQDSLTGEIFIANRSDGASIAYSYDQQNWTLYNGSFNPKSHKQVFVKAVRYGWKPSAVTEFNMTK